MHKGEDLSIKICSLHVYALPLQHRGAYIGKYLPSCDISSAIDAGGR